MSQVDRGAGLVGTLGVKAPCRVATTANITLSGLQTIDGVVLLENDRVLVKDQTTTTENGIYSAQLTTWIRVPDFDGIRDVLNGTLVVISSGGQAGNIYRTVSTDPTTPGSSAITFSNLVGNISSNRTTATAGQTVITGLSYTPGTNNLLVYVNGSKQLSSVNYNETSPTSITFLTALNLGDTIECLATAYQVPGTGAVVGVAATAPLASTGGTNPTISIPQATAVVDGYLKATDFVTFNNKYAVGGALGTPSSGVATNLTGTAAGLTAGNVTTNANLTGPITSVGNATSIASQTGTGTKIVVDTSPTITGATLTTAALNGTLGATTPSTVVATDLTTTGNTILGNASTDTLNVGNGGLVKDASGNVGIGTGATVNSTKLSILPASATAPAIHLWTTNYSATYGTKIYSQSENEAGTVSSFSNITKITTAVNGNLSIPLWLAYSSNSTSDYQYWSTNGVERMRINGSGNVNIAGLTASSAVATDASKNLVSVTNTGTGNNVLATSPTITGATLTTAALNGSLGATTPSTVVATTIHGTTSIRTTNTFEYPALGSMDGAIKMLSTSGVYGLFGGVSSGGYSWLQTGRNDANATAYTLYLNNQGGDVNLASDKVIASSTGLAVTGIISCTGLLKPQQATTAGAPAYVKGAIYFDTTLNKLRVGGATAWETITSV